MVSNYINIFTINDVSTVDEQKKDAFSRTIPDSYVPNNAIKVVEGLVKKIKV
jgi:hypothetical protein